MKKFVYFLIFIVVFIFFLLNIFSINGYSFFGYRVYRIGSGSMTPFLKVNDIIIIKSCDEYKVNDVITYRTDYEYITHRIISIDDDVIITKGDANNVQDEPIYKNKIVGKMVYKFKFLGFIYYFLSKPFSWVLVFAGGIITCLIPERKK